MKKVYYLKTCDTCKRIMKGLNLEGFELREIKSSPITKDELEELYRLSPSYEGLFNKRAQKFKKLGLKDQLKKDMDYKNWILQEYTFLKRPIFIIDDKVYAGNSKKTIEELEALIN